MHYVYFLWSNKLQKIYIGETSNVRKRLNYHNGGFQRYTKSGMPWQCIAYVAFDTKIVAKREEKRLKKCKNKKYYKRYILEYGKKL